MELLNKKLEQMQRDLQQSEAREGSLAVALGQIGPQIVHRQSEHDRLEQLHQQRLDREVEPLSNQVQALRHDLDQSVSREHALRATTQQLTTQQLESQSRETELCEVRQRKDIELGKLVKRNLQMELQLESKAALETQVEALLEQLDANSASVELSSIAMKGQIQGLQHDLEQSEARGAALQVALEQIQPLSNKLESLQTELLESQIRETELIHESKSSLKEQEAELTSQILGLEAELVVQTSGLEDEQWTLQQQLKESTVREATSRVEAQEAGALSAQVEAQVMLLEQENSELRVRAERVEPMSSEIRSLKMELQNAVERSDTLDSQLRPLQHDLQVISALCHSLLSL